MEQETNRAWWVLRLGLGIGPFLAGLDKFFNLLTDWTGYLSPVVTNTIPLAPQTFMHLVGIIEMIAGIMVLTRFTREAAYVVAVWLVAIAGNLLLTGQYLDIAVRDLEIALAAFALGQLTQARQRILASGHTPATSPVSSVA